MGEPLWTSKGSAGDDTSTPQENWTQVRIARHIVDDVDRPCQTGSNIWSIWRGTHLALKQPEGKVSPKVWSLEECLW